MSKNVDSQSTQPCCDVVVDESGELRIKIAGDWVQPDRDLQLAQTLRGLAGYGAPTFVDTRGLGQVSQTVRELLAAL